MLYGKMLFFSLFIFTEANDMTYNKVKRQPPSGFHAIRGR